MAGKHAFAFSYGRQAGYWLPVASVLEVLSWVFKWQKREGVTS